MSLALGLVHQDGTEKDMTPAGEFDGLRFSRVLPLGSTAISLGNSLLKREWYAAQPRSSGSWPKAVVCR